MYVSVCVLTSVSQIITAARRDF